MFKLIKINDFYLLTDGKTTVLQEDEDTKTYSLSILAATNEEITKSNKIKLLQIKSIDSHILEDDDNNEWEVEIDTEFNIYLKSQLI